MLSTCYPQVHSASKKKLSTSPTTTIILIYKDKLVAVALFQKRDFEEGSMCVSEGNNLQIPFSK